jgi:hypothetical protein
VRLLAEFVHAPEITGLTPSFLRVAPGSPRCSGPGSCNAAPGIAGRTPVLRVAAAIRTGQDRIPATPRRAAPGRRRCCVS